MMPPLAVLWRALLHDPDGPPDHNLDDIIARLWAAGLRPGMELDLAMEISSLMPMLVLRLEQELRMHEVLNAPQMPSSELSPSDFFGQAVMPDNWQSMTDEELAAHLDAAGVPRLEKTDADSDDN